MNSQVADPRWRASIDPPLTPLPIPLTKDHHCCKKTAHGRRSRFLHKLASGNDGNREVGEPKCDCPALQWGRVRVGGAPEDELSDLLQRLASALDAGAGVAKGFGGGGIG